MKTPPIEVARCLHDVDEPLDYFYGRDPEDPRRRFTVDYDGVEWSNHFYGCCRHAHPGVQGGAVRLVFLDRRVVHVRARIFVAHIRAGWIAHDRGPGYWKEPDWSVVKQRRNRWDEQFPDQSLRSL